MTEENKVAKTAPSKAKKKDGVSVGKFIRETVIELKKVVWPTKRQLAVFTVIVIVASILMSLFLAGVDSLTAYADKFLLRK